MGLGPSPPSLTPFCLSYPPPARALVVCTQAFPAQALQWLISSQVLLQWCQCGSNLQLLLMLSPLFPCRHRQASPLSSAVRGLGSVCPSHLGSSGQDIFSVQSTFWCSCACLARLKITHCSPCLLGIWEIMGHHQMTHGLMCWWQKQKYHKFSEGRSSFPDRAIISFCLSL